MSLRPSDTRLELSVVLAGQDGRSRDVVIDAPADVAGSAVIEALVVYAGLPADAGKRLVCERTGRAIARDAPLVAAGLLHGDRLVVGPVDRPEEERRAAAVLVVCGGRAAGERFPVAEGETVVGRDAAADVTIDDPSLSGRHVVLHVGARGVFVSDAG